MTRPAKTNKNSTVEKKPHNPQATRETVESIVIAVVLAFLFRGFVAEAFVIPTGSMAPTLMGRHVDVWCPECDYRYQTGASEENNDPQRLRTVQVTICPVCRFPKKLERDTNPDERSFTGDRILVSKYQYELAEPSRFDVIVFKFPQNAKQNYIKRLIGLPNELVRIHHGDVYVGKKLFDLPDQALDPVVRPPSDLSAIQQQFAAAGYPLSDDVSVQHVSEPDRPRSVYTQVAHDMWSVRDAGHQREYLIRISADHRAEVYSEPTIVRKPPKKERALLQLVHDTEHEGNKILKQVGWPLRWKDRGPKAVWTEPARGSYQVQAAGDEWAWLRYRHIYPSDHEWRLLQNQRVLPESIDRADGALISDYYAYNDRLSRGFGRSPGQHWVGDLALEAEFEVTSDKGELAFDLVEAGTHYRCTVNIASGQATLSISDDSPFIGDDGKLTTETPTAQTSIRGPGSYTVRFVNADDQLRLWVDGDVAAFNAPTTYAPPKFTSPRSTNEDRGDLEPLGVGARNAAVKVSRLKVYRDVYYVAVMSSDDREYSPRHEDIQSLFRSPELWPTTSLFESRRTLEFVIGEHQYFPLGDNSPQSADGRMWDEEPYFSQEMLIGKAMLIYWPHGWNRPFPFRPNFSRMGLIH